MTDFTSVQLDDMLAMVRADSPEGLAARSDGWNRLYGSLSAQRATLLEQRDALEPAWRSKAGAALITRVDRSLSMLDEQMSISRENASAWAAIAAAAQRARTEAARLEGTVEGQVQTQTAKAVADAQRAAPANSTPPAPNTDLIRTSVKTDVANQLRPVMVETATVYRESLSRIKPLTAPAPRIPLPSAAAAPGDAVAASGAPMVAADGPADGSDQTPPTPGGASSQASPVYRAEMSSGVTSGPDTASPTGIQAFATGPTATTITSRASTTTVPANGATGFRAGSAGTASGPVTRVATGFPSGSAGTTPGTATTAVAGFPSGSAGTTPGTATTAVAGFPSGSAGAASGTATTAVAASAGDGEAADVPAGTGTIGSPATPSPGPSSTSLASSGAPGWAGSSSGPGSPAEQAGLAGGGGVIASPFVARTQQAATARPNATSGPGSPDLDSTVLGPAGVITTPGRSQRVAAEALSSVTAAYSAGEAGLTPVIGLVPAAGAAGSRSAPLAATATPSARALPETTSTPVLAEGPATAGPATSPARPAPATSFRAVAGTGPVTAAAPAPGSATRAGLKQPPATSEDGPTPIRVGERAVGAAPVSAGAEVEGAPGYPGVAAGPGASTAIGRGSGARTTTAPTPSSRDAGAAGRSVPARRPVGADEPPTGRGLSGVQAPRSATLEAAGDSLTAPRALGAAPAEELRGPGLSEPASVTPGAGSGSGSLPPAGLGAVPPRGSGSSIRPATPKPPARPAVAASDPEPGPFSPVTRAAPAEGTSPRPTTRSVTSSTGRIVRRVGEGESESASTPFGGTGARSARSDDEDGWYTELDEDRDIWRYEEAVPPVIGTEPAAPFRSLTTEGRP